MTTLHDFGGVLRRRPLDTFSSVLSQSHGHGSWLVKCEVALKLNVTSHTRLKAMVERAETIQVHFTDEGGGLKAQRRLHE